MVERLPRAVVALACLALCAGLAACSSSPSTPSAAAHSSSTADRVSLYAMPTNLGTIVTLPYGSPVYVNIGEQPGGGSACTHSCAALWVPVLTGPQPAAESGIVKAEVGTAGYGSARQVTYFGHRLYYDKLDHHPLVATGQGSHGDWYVILPNGQVLRQLS
jgi:predicted lipoprotein with Yx(FWY)xxD motif